MLQNRSVAIQVRNEVATARGKYMSSLSNIILWHPRHVLFKDIL